MLITIQFPLVDVREFVSGPTHKLPTPAWPAPEPDSTFVRNLGAVRRRPLGGVSGWLREDAIVEANRGLRIQPIHDFPTKIRPVFRRFYHDGLATGKFEVGFALWGRADFSGQLKNLLGALVKLPVIVPDPTTERHVEHPLGQAGNPLARLYLRSTTETLPAFTPTTWWVQAGEPVILVLVNQREERLDLVSLPGHKLDFAEAVPGLDFLGHHTLSAFGRNIRVWSMGCSSDSPRLRELRLFLLRLHAERACLRRVLSLTRQKDFNPEPRRRPAESLQRYLHNSLQRIAKLEKNARSRSDKRVLEIAREAGEGAVPGEVDSLIASLEDCQFRLSLIRRVKDHVMADTWRDGVVFILDKNSRPQGVGFVVSLAPLRVVTCAHVLDQAGWRFENWQDPVRIQPYHRETGHLKLFTDRTCFRQAIAEDVAILVGEGVGASELRALPLGAGAEAEGHRFMAMGYPRAVSDRRLAATGSIVMLFPGYKGDPDYLQLTAQDLTHGYSGSPVWDSTGQRVVGMVNAGIEVPNVRAHRDTRFAVPAESLVKICPDLHLS